MEEGRQVGATTSVGVEDVPAPLLLMAGEGAATAAGTPDVGAAVAVEDGDGGMGTVVPASAPVDGGNAGAGVEAEGRAEAGEGLPSVGRPDPARSSKAVARRVNTLSGWRMTKRRRFKENASGWFNPTGS